MNGDSDTIVKARKAKIRSTTMQANFVAVVTALISAWNLWPGIDNTSVDGWQAFGTALAAAVAAGIGMWRRTKVGDLT